MKIYMLTNPNFPGLNVEGVFATRPLADEALGLMHPLAGYVIREWEISNSLEEWLRQTRRPAPIDPLSS